MRNFLFSMRTFVIFLLLVGKAVYGIVDSEDILGVQSIFHIFHEIDGGIWEDLLHESLTDFSDTMVVRKTAALL